MLVHHIHRFAHFVEGRISDEVRLLIAFVQNVLHIIKIAFKRTTTFTNGRKILIHALGDIFLERTRTIVADLGCDVLFRTTRDFPYRR